MAELTGSTPDRPFPPGRFPVVVVGSGPGGIQLSYDLDRLGVEHAVISADDAPGGMFRRWPHFQRLLSWTKPYAPAERGTRTYERYDWNSLLAREPQHKALMPEFMDGSSYFPSRPEMEMNLAAFAGRTGVRVRYGTRWTATRREEGPNGDELVLETTDGEYRTPAAVFAVGVAQPWTPSTPGVEHTHHYADVRPAETYADHRIFIAGKSVSAFELATGLLPWARQIVLASPSAARLTVVTRSLLGVRARYVQPYEDFVLGGGVSIIDASIESVERTASGTLVVRTKRTDGGDLAVEVDDVINATGFVTPLLDLPKLGVTTFGHSALPAQTPLWESSTVPGIFFAGTITQGSGGLKKHGVPSNSGAVHGARYNADVLARHLAKTRAGIDPPKPSIAPADLAARSQEELTKGPELYHQKAYLAWVASADPAGGYRDDGIQPLAHVLDAGGPDALITTIESDGTGAIYPVLYVRRNGAIDERPLEPDAFNDFSGAGHRRAIEDAVAALER